MSAAKWSAPNWCNPCGGYRSRDHECERQQRRADFPADLPEGFTRENVDQAAMSAIPEASDRRYVAGWNAGYEAAMRDLAARGDAA